MTTKVRALEFFSGIGGLHYGLEWACSSLPVEAQVLAAFDINTVANSIYTHNFNIAPLTKTIDRLTLNDLQAFGDIDLWLLSPPCQPVTAGGKGLDDKDDRSKGLLHLIEMIKLLETPPRMVFLENVPNFEKSQCRKKLVTALRQLNYIVNEFLISPMDFGIANDRRRYYLCARQDRTNELWRERSMSELTAKDLEPQLITQWTSIQTPPPLASYLEVLTDATPYIIPEEFIIKRTGFRFDVVTPQSTRTSTITKSYGTKMVTRCGSFLLSSDEQISYDDGEALVKAGLRFLFRGGKYWEILSIAKS
ncbi:C-5 cytosine-specific DNA methylase [Blyttiomyces sp. JEL0837]|nr:C-5 cytosine-specific DNA methylase [Blyttiomyces sp. JEL0837]